MADPVWIIDTSSIIEIRRSVPVTDRARLFARLTTLVQEGRLKFPKQVIEELRRAATPDRRDTQLDWAGRVVADACSAGPTLEEVKEVLSRVRDVLDPSKDSGADEADPYVLAIAARLRAEGFDARIVTQETKDSPQKISLNTAAGLLGIPSVPLRGLLRAEGLEHVS
ncbi:MAG: DUF4411 family protein [Acidobacteria bacterium]|nr:DUF4411 family protein [Acidobacteriota bacterium]